MFDFSKKRVRIDGYVLSKYELCLEIHRRGNYHDTLTYVIYPEIYSYQDCVEKLKSLID